MKAKKTNKEIENLKQKYTVENRFIQKEETVYKSNRLIDTINYIRNFIYGESREFIFQINLDHEYNVINYHLSTIGIHSKVNANHRDTLMSASLSGAKYIILLHNHPNWEVYPSEDDTLTFNWSNDFFDSLGLKLLDNIIISSGPMAYSIKTESFLNFQNPEDITIKKWIEILMDENNVKRTKDYKKLKQQFIIDTRYIQKECILNQNNQILNASAAFNFFKKCTKNKKGEFLLQINLDHYYQIINYRLIDLESQKKDNYNVEEFVNSTGYEIVYSSAFSGAEHTIIMRNNPKGWDVSHLKEDEILASGVYLYLKAIGVHLIDSLIVSFNGAFIHSVLTDSYVLLKNPNANNAEIKKGINKFKIKTTKQKETDEGESLICKNYKKISAFSGVKFIKKNDRQPRFKVISTYNNKSKDETVWLYNSLEEAQNACYSLWNNSVVLAKKSNNYLEKNSSFNQGTGVICWKDGSSRTFKVKQNTINS